VRRIGDAAVEIAAGRFEVFLHVVDAAADGLGFGFELVAELTRHHTRTTHPPTDAGRQLGQLLRTQHNQCQTKDHQIFGPADFKHAGPSAVAGG